MEPTESEHADQEQKPQSETGAGSEGARSASHDLIRAAAEDLWLVGTHERESSASDRKPVKARPPGRKLSTAELKRSLWSSKPERESAISRELIEAVAKDLRLVGDKGRERLPIQVWNEKLQPSARVESSEPPDKAPVPFKQELAPEVAPADVVQETPAVMPVDMAEKTPPAAPSEVKGETQEETLAASEVAPVDVAPEAPATLSVDLAEKTPPAVPAEVKEETQEETAMASEVAGSVPAVVQADVVTETPGAVPADAGGNASEPVRPAEKLTSLPPVVAPVIVADEGLHREAIFLDVHVAEPEEEKVQEKEPAIGPGIFEKYQGYLVGTAGVLFVVFVACDVYIETGAAEWLKTLLKLVALALGLTFSIAGLWSQRIMTKCIAGVLIALFLLHSINRRPIQHLLHRKPVPPAPAMAPEPEIKRDMGGR